MGAVVAQPANVKDIRKAADVSAFFKMGSPGPSVDAVAANKQRLRLPTFWRRLRREAVVETTISLDIVVEGCRPTVLRGVGPGQTTVGLAGTAGDREALVGHLGVQAGQIEIGREAAVGRESLGSESGVRIVVAESVTPGITTASRLFEEQTTDAGVLALGECLTIGAGTAIEIVERTALDRDRFEFGDFEIEFTFTLALEVEPGGFRLCCRDGRERKNRRSGHESQHRFEAHLKEPSL